MRGVLYVLSGEHCAVITPIFISRYLRAERYTSRSIESIPHTESVLSPRPKPTARLITAASFSADSVIIARDFRSGLPRPSLARKAAQVCPSEAVNGTVALQICEHCGATFSEFIAHEVPRPVHCMRVVRGCTGRIHEWPARRPTCCCATGGKAPIGWTGGSTGSLASDTEAAETLGGGRGWGNAGHQSVMYTYSRCVGM